MLASATSGFPGMAGGSFGFSRNAMMRSSLSTCMTPKPVASARGTSMQATVTSAPLLDVLLQHLLVVHLVDMVAGQDHHVARAIALA